MVCFLSPHKEGLYKICDADAFLLLLAGADSDFSWKGVTRFGKFYKVNIGLFQLTLL